MAVAGILTCDALGPENQAPVPVGSIPEQVVEVGSMVVVDVAAYFMDPDGDSLTFTAISSSAAVAAATVSGSFVTVSGVATGSAMVTVTARDSEGLTAEQSFAVTVPNRAPAAVGAIADQDVYVDSVVVVDVAEYFADPDGDALEHSASASDTTRVAVTVAQSMVTVTGLAVGSATVTVTAVDPGGLSAEQSFGVTVPNRAPGAVGMIADHGSAGGQCGGAGGLGVLHRSGPGCAGVFGCLVGLDPGDGRGGGRHGDGDGGGGGERDGDGDGTGSGRTVGGAELRGQGPEPGA